MRIEQGKFDQVSDMYHLYTDDHRHVTTCTIPAIAQTSTGLSLAHSSEEMESSMEQLKRIRYHSIFKPVPPYKRLKQFVVKISSAISPIFYRYARGLRWAEAISAFLDRNASPKFFRIIPMVYIWILRNGYVKAAKRMEHRALSSTAQSDLAVEGFRWLIAFNKAIEPETRYVILIDWMSKEKILTQNDRIERWLAIHGLAAMDENYSKPMKERIFALYTDFIKNEKNRDIENIFGEAIEDDFLTMRDRGEKNNDLGSFLDSWLMRRYAITEVLGEPTVWWIRIFAVVFYLLFLGLAFQLFDYRLLFPALSIHTILPPEYQQLIQDSSPVLAFVTPILLFIWGWSKGGWRLSKIIWGTAIGWLFVFSASLTNLILQQFENKEPQLLQLKGLELFGALILFMGIVVFIIWREIRHDAAIKPVFKQLKRLTSMSLFALFFGLLEGCIFIALVSWFFVGISHWFERWATMLLAVGTIQAMAIGVITQLIWESSRLTETLRR